MPKRANPVAMGTFGLIIGPADVGAPDLEGVLSVAVKVQEKLYAAFVRQFNLDGQAFLDELRTLGHNLQWWERLDCGARVRDLLKFGIEPVDEIHEVCLQHLPDSSWVSKQIAALNDVHARLRDAHLEPLIGTSSDMVVHRDVLRAVILPQHWLSGLLQRVLSGPAVKPMVTAFAENKVLTINGGSAVFDGWLWERTSRDRHLSSDDFALAVKDAHEREQRRLHSLKQRHYVPDVVPPVPTVDDAVRDSKWSHASPEEISRSLRTISPYEFESLAARILEAAGVSDVWVTPQSGDEGIDVRGTISVSGLLSIPVALQAKHVTGSVHTPVVREFQGSLSPGEVGIIITTGEFSPGAVAASRRDGRTPVTLIGMRQLIAIIGSLGVEF